MPEPERTASGRLPKVAVLGGGAAGCTAALELAQPGWQDRYDSITLYQYGARLGGKGASGRGPNDRIEEHGLHIWLGFYENSFRLLGECYDELARPPEVPIRTLEEAFERASLFIVQEPRGDGWLPWFANFPDTDDMPGRGDPPAMPSMFELMIRGLHLASTFVTSSRSGPASQPAVEGLRLLPTHARPTSERGISLHPPTIALSHRVTTALRELYLQLWSLVSEAKHGAIAACIAFAEALPDDPHDHTSEHHAMLRNMVERAIGWLHHAHAHPDDLSDDERREWYLADIVLATVRGLLHDGALNHEHGLDVLDQWDFSEWLVLHGAAPESAACGLVTTLMYDLPFSYRDGDPASPSIGAGTALRGALHTLFLYRGAVAWKMRAGMGDVVFAPMYEVLRRRGVKVEFFHRIEELQLDDSGTRIAGIRVTRQAALKDPDALYDPLVYPHGLPSWPSEPNCEQLTEPVTAREVESFWSTRPPVEPPPGRSPILRDGIDFDEVVLAIPVGAHPYICAELIDRVNGWRDMVDRVASIYTQAFQVWLTEEMDDLGCAWPQATTGGYLEPFDTYADMRQLIPRESFPDGTVRSIAYFCNAMPTPKGVPSRDDRSIPAEHTAMAHASAVAFLRDHITPLWPRAVRRYPTEFRWEILYDEQHRSGEARFESQFWRANVDPSERYVLALPDTVQYRMTADGSGVDNLVLAGDWTRNGLNSGCVESAVTSGMLAAAAVSARYGYAHHRTIHPVVDQRRKRA